MQRRPRPFQLETAFSRLNCGHRSWPASFVAHNRRSTAAARLQHVQYVLQPTSNDWRHREDSIRRNLDSQRPSLKLLSGRVVRHVHETNRCSVCPTNCDPTTDLIHTFGRTFCVCALWCVSHIPPVRGSFRAIGRSSTCATLALLLLSAHRSSPQTHDLQCSKPCAIPPLSATYARFAPSRHTLAASRPRARAASMARPRRDPKSIPSLALVRAPSRRI